MRKTWNVSVAHAWDFLFTPEGMEIWLGKIMGPLEPGTAYETSNGVSGKINLIKPYSHIRLTWKKKDWNNISALQIRVIPSKEKTTISFHQDKLTDGKMREEMKFHWDKILQKIVGIALDLLKR